MTGFFLNIRRDASMEGFWIFQGSGYARFLCIQALHKVLNMPDYGGIMPYDRVLNMSGQHFTGFKSTSGSKYERDQKKTQLWICEGYTGCWICLNKPEYVFIISQHVWICLNNAKYDWICRHIPEKSECWVCHNSEFVLCST